MLIALFIIFFVIPVIAAGYALVSDLISDAKFYRDFGIK